MKPLHKTISILGVDVSTGDTIGFNSGIEGGWFQGKIYRIALQFFIFEDETAISFRSIRDGFEEGNVWGFCVVKRGIYETK